MSEIVKDPEILGGMPVFAGTRVPVKNLFDALIGGDSIPEFLDDFPTVTFEQVQAVLENTEGISFDPAVCHGKPVIKGTRVLVSSILGALAGGDSQEDVERDYAITSGQVEAALQFASDK